MNIGVSQLLIGYTITNWQNKSANHQTGNGFCFSHNTKTWLFVTPVDWLKEWNFKSLNQQTLKSHSVVTNSHSWLLAGKWNKRTTHSTNNIEHIQYHYKYCTSIYTCTIYFYSYIVCTLSKHTVHNNNDNNNNNKITQRVKETITSEKKTLMMCLPTNTNDVDDNLIT